MTKEEEILLSLEDINPREIACHIEFGTLHKWTNAWKAATSKIIISALRPVSREHLDVVINSLKLRLKNNEEHGVVYIPKFAVEEMIERLEALRDD